MVLNFLRRRKAAAARAPFAAPLRSESLVFAVGDIHGRADLLRKLLERIDAEMADHDGPAELVFLGDYVDRGDHSREVLDLLTERAGRDAERPPVFLMGNHERMLLDFVREPESGRKWLRFGGLQTLMSYGVRGLGSIGEGSDLGPVREKLVEEMGPHLAFLEGLSLSHRNGNVLFVHAAADPAMPPDLQEPETLLWGSPSFLRQPREDSIWVVHGHTVVDEPQAEDGRIAVDTGAYFSGRLTAARIEGDQLRFVTS